MYIGHIEEIAKSEMHNPGVAEKVTKQILVGPEQGWEGWVMRKFSLAPGGFSPRHIHPWPHINYMIEGEGVMFLNGEEHSVRAGSVAYVPAGSEHQFRNVSNADFSFICIVPEEGDK